MSAPIAVMAGHSYAIFLPGFFYRINYSSDGFNTDLRLMKSQGVSRYQLIIMAVTAGVCVANIYYNQPILKAIGLSFHAKENEVGIISVLTQAGYGLGLFFITPLGDKTNRKKLLFLLQAALIIALIALTLVTNLTGVYIMSLLVGILGVAAQVILPMAAGMDPLNRGKNVGFIFTGILIGVLAARVFSGYIAAWLGWRYVYGISSVMVFFSAILVQTSLPGARKTFEGNYGALLKSTIEQFTRFAILRRTVLLGALIFGAFCSFWTTLTFHLSQPPFGYHTDTIGLFGILAIGGALLAPAIGRFTDKGNPAKLQIVTVCMLIAGVLFIMIFPHSPAAFIIAVLLLDVGVQATQVTNVTTIYSLDAAAHSRINTVYMTTYFIGGAIGTFAGVLCWKTGGWNLVTWQILLWAIMALIVVLTGLTHRRVNILPVKYP